MITEIVKSVRLKCLTTSIAETIHNLMFNRCGMYLESGSVHHILKKMVLGVQNKKQQDRHKKSLGIKMS